MSEAILGLELMGYGLAGVFAVLIMFYFVIIILVKIFPVKNDEK